MSDDLVKKLDTEAERIARNMLTAGAGPGGGIPDFHASWTLQYLAARKIEALQQRVAELETACRIFKKWLKIRSDTVYKLRERVAELEQELIERDEIYCHVCGSCGIDECCSPDTCTGGARCLYPIGGRKMTDLKPCPCGEVPKSIKTFYMGSDNWSVVPSCCPWWKLLIVHRLGPGSVHPAAIEAWNSAPRAGEGIQKGGTDDKQLPHNAAT